MSDAEINCTHACKNTCAMLNEALRKEAALVRYYEGMLEECNLPEVRDFVVAQVEDKRKGILNIISMLNEIHAKSQVADGIVSSFNGMAT